MALSSHVELRVAATLTSTMDLVSGYVPLNYLTTIDLGDGTGADQADKVFSDTRTLTASATEDLDFAGVLVDAFGQTFTMARLKLLLVVAAAANTNNVNVIRPAANGVPIFLAASDGVAVRPKGFFLYFAPDATGVAITAGTGDLVTFTNSAGTTPVSYTIIAIGASA